MNNGDDVNDMNDVDDEVPFIYSTTFKFIQGWFLGLSRLERIMFLSAIAKLDAISGAREHAQKNGKAKVLKSKRIK